MVIFVLLLGVFLLALGIAYAAYRYAYYSSKKGWNDPYLTMEGGHYQPDSVMYQLIHEMEQLPCEEVSIVSRDGLTLRGRYYHVADGAPLQIQMHGYRGHALRDFSGGHKLARENGMNTLVVDHRAHGRSEGHVISFGINERYDCADWAAYAAKRWPESPIVLAGISMGAATVLMASDLPLPEQVKGIIADCSYSSPRAIIKKVCWDLPWFMHLLYPFTSLSALLFGHFDPDSGSAVGAVSNTTLPILLIHGEEDSLVPCDMSREIAAACASPVRLETFPGADHGGSYLMDTARYARVVKEFLQSCGVL